VRKIECDLRIEWQHTQRIQRSDMRRFTDSVVLRIYTVT
jgi:hypothetical protein